MADLAMHYTDGRLDHEEYDERLDAIWTARTRADLALLFSDLPRLQASPPPRRGRAPTAGRVRACGCLCSRCWRVLIVLSVIVDAPLWLLVFPLMFLRVAGAVRGARPRARPGRLPTAAAARTAGRPRRRPPRHGCPTSGTMGR